jgi:hypothetical protein
MPLQTGNVSPPHDVPSVRRTRIRHLASLLAVTSTLIILGASAEEASAMSMRGSGFGGFHGSRGMIVRAPSSRIAARPNRISGSHRIAGSDRRPGEHGRRPHQPPATLVTITPRLTPGLPSPAPILVSVPPGGSPPSRFAPGAAFPSPLNIPTANETRYRPDEVLVGFAANTNPQAVIAIAQGQRLALLGIHRLALIDTTLYRFRITDGRSVPAVIASFGSDSRISRAQPNYVYAAQDEATKGDATKADMAVQVDGDPAQYVLGKLDIPLAHAMARGSGVLIAVIDSTIDASHPDLRGVVAGRFDAVKSPAQPHRHGTAMASAIAARGRLSGIAPAAKILAVRAFDPTAVGAISTTTRLLDSLQWASDSGARIINMSFAGPADPRLRDMVAAARRKGLTLIAAAGNDGPTAPPAYPAAYPEVIAVTATDADDHAFRQANHGAYLAVAAPGVDILVAAPNGGYDFTTGTSVAAAHVSGLAALLLERYPSLTPAALEAILLRTSTDLGTPGRDEEFGAGLVNAYGALATLSAQSAKHLPSH